MFDAAITSTEWMRQWLLIIMWIMANRSNIKHGLMMAMITLKWGLRSSIWRNSRALWVEWMKKSLITTVERWQISAKGLDMIWHDITKHPANESNSFKTSQKTRIPRSTFSWSGNLDPIWAFWLQKAVPFRLLWVAHRPHLATNAQVQVGSMYPTGSSRDPARCRHADAPNIGLFQRKGSHCHDRKCHCAGASVVSA